MKVTLMNQPLSFSLPSANLYHVHSLPRHRRIRTMMLAITARMKRRQMIRTIPQSSHSMTIRMKMHQKVNDNHARRSQDALDPVEREVVRMVKARRIRQQELD